MRNKPQGRSTLKLPRLPAGRTQESPTRRSIKPQEGPDVSQTYGIYCLDTLKCVAEQNATLKREIASLTKMMTLLCVINICKKFKVLVSKAYFRVTANAASTRGTSAELESKEWVTIEDLLYGMMLPSGNDAATVLSQNFGAFLYYERLGQSGLLTDLKSLDVTEDAWNVKLYTEQFVKYMNATAKELGMASTLFINPHGLDSSFRLESYSTVSDLAALAKTLYDNPACLPFMSRAEYTAELKTISGKEVSVRKLTWQNTNKLLGSEGYLGGKTGQTANAGNCLASIYENKTGCKYVVILLGSATKETRFRETQMLIQKHIEQ